MGGIPSHPSKWDDLTVLLEEEERLMEEWRAALADYLNTASALSERCCIITNAKPGWVDACIARFAPDLVGIFARLQIVYAGECLQKSDRLDPSSPRGRPVQFYGGERDFPEEMSDRLTKAKLEAMRKEAKKFYSRYPDQTWKNIISVGDAPYEHYAVQELGFKRKGPERERLRVKAIATPQDPSIAELTYRLKMATILFPDYVAYNDDLILDMNTPERMQAIAAALKIPELKNVIRAHIPPNGIPEEEAQAELDELVMMVHEKKSQGR